jgi:hypothetical protein
MAKSLSRQALGRPLHVLCLTDRAFEVLAGAALENITLLRLRNLEEADPELLAVKQNRTIVEYYFTLTSCLGHYLMKRLRPNEVLTYLDSDVFFYSSIQPLVEEFKEKSIGATYHRYPEHGVPRQGRFNVGWVSWRKDRSGESCLARYRAQCLEWCYLREEGGKYADQSYLDAWDKLPGFHAFEHRGANVAVWNLKDYRLGDDGSGLTVDGFPLLFFHFHKFAYVGGGWYDTNLWSSRRIPRFFKRHVVIPYIKALLATRLVTDAPITGSHLRHFPYRKGFGRFVRNAARLGLTLARSTLVYHKAARANG